MVDIFMFTTLIFVIGLCGIVLFRTNLLLVLMGIELLFFCINLNFLFFSYVLDDLLGQCFFIYVLTVAGAESGVGLAILVSYYRLRGEIWLDLINKLKG